MEEKVELRFSVGDYIFTNINGYGYIVDILRSESSPRVIVCVEFTYNFPNPRYFDMLLVEPGRMNGVDLWEVVAAKNFHNKLVEKRDSLAGVVAERISRNFS
jgi:hypothetical protein